MLADHNFDTVGHIMKRYTSMWSEVRAYPSTQDPNLNLGAVVRRDYQDENVLHRLLVYERRIENSFFKYLNELKKQKRKNPSDPTLTPDSAIAAPNAQNEPNSIEARNIANTACKNTYSQSPRGGRAQSKPDNSPLGAFTDLNRPTDSPRRTSATVRRY